jgi:peptidoglycan L-alanyl-D-glutamate endopeptidase CwlK
MPSFRLGLRSCERLHTIHPDLRAVVEKAIQDTEVDFTVLEGFRTLERQKKLVEAGSSWTMNSRHLTGHAVDLGAWVDGQVDWSWPLYYKIADAMKKAAEELNVSIVWGGDWVSVKDGPHFELDREFYPV